MTMETSYETPAMVDVGEFADLTRGNWRGRWVDVIGWFDFF
ncbi:lasso RiPP family leader peptide-containing protein [Streptomyces sp. NBC_00868]|nr:lasso RiPP family leader peptide-containing protein [Streptomyces sp. NBC_00868]